MKAPEGTFSFRTVVPAPEDRAGTWLLESWEGRDRGTAPPMCNGHEASLEVTDAGPTPNAGTDRGVWRPFVLRSRFHLKCDGRSACFHVDKGITSALRSGDVLHMARTATGGLAVSALRGQGLVVAVGAITAVPLGTGIQARLSPERWDEAVATLRPAPGVRNWNPRKRYRYEWPVEIRIDGDIALLFGANREMGEYEVFMQHGFCVRREWPWAGFTRAFGRKIARSPAGKDECVALARIGACSPTAANMSALLLSADGLGDCE